MKIGGHRLLIVEDEPLLRITTADALRKEGWTVDVAEDGVKGAALFEQHLHDVVLTDLVMPRLGGMELLKRIKALQPDTTVVIITAHGTVDRAVEAMREGASDFITKPFSMAQLVVRVANVCSVRVLREQNVRLQEQLEQSLGGRFGHAIEPVLRPIGFDWQLGVGIIGAFAAREVFVSTLGVVFGIGEADEENKPLREALRDARHADGSAVMTPLSGVSLMVFFLLACQCMSTLAVVRRETGGWGWPALMFVYMSVLAWVASLLVYQGGRLLGFS